MNNIGSQVDGIEGQKLGVFKVTPLIKYKARI